MRRIQTKLIIAILIFAFGVWVDTYLRTRKSGITDCSCMSFKCRLVTVADHPSLLLTHPLEVVELLLTQSGNKISAMLEGHS